MNRTIELDHVTVYLPMQIVALLVSVAIAAFFLGGALTTTFTAATWIIAFILIAYMGIAVYTVQEEMAHLVEDGVKQTAQAVGLSFEEDIEGLAAAVCDFVDLGRYMITEIEEHGVVSNQSISGLRDILAMISAEEEAA